MDGCTVFMVYLTSFSVLLALRGAWLGLLDR